MTDKKENPLNTNWCIWYHNPMDKNWTLNSYKKIYEFDSLEKFWDLYKEWNNYLPCIYDGMFFLMRKINNTLIYPLWEDKHNKNGGFWSFKVNKDIAEEIWIQLSVHLISESLCQDPKNSNIINGISISPKKNFCIIKIWNNNKQKCDIAILNHFSDKINFNECMFKCHIDNISNDKMKTLKYNKYNKNKNQSKKVFRKSGLMS
jgi:hypothetical protein